MHLLKKVKKYGEISFSINGNEISTINIVAKNSVDKINFFSMAKKVYYSWIDLLRKKYGNNVKNNMDNNVKNNADNNVNNSISDGLLTLHCMI